MVLKNLIYDSSETQKLLIYSNSPLTKSKHFYGHRGVEKLFLHCSNLGFNVFYKVLPSIGSDGRLDRLQSFNVVLSHYGLLPPTGVFGFIAATFSCDSIFSRSRLLSADWL